MDFVIQKSSNKHLIIFVHGLNGSASTWQGTSEHFVEVLKKNEIIKNNFDLAIFTYPTKIFQISILKKIGNTIAGFLSNRPKEDIKAFNVGIDSVSRPLESEVRSIEDKYETITFIAHSMGGLVTKSALTWVSDDILKKVRLFISLSVPHMGAQLAGIGSMLLGDNPQIVDLAAMGRFTTGLNERFSNRGVKPKIIYQSGHQDTVVPRTSAVLANVSADVVENTSDDHFSVLLIKNSRSNTVLQRIIKELNLLIQPIGGVDVGVPQDTPFGPFVLAIAAKLKVRVDLACFSPLELQTLLRSDNVRSTSIEDFFVKVGDLASSKLPAYEVIRENGTKNYTFVKKIERYE